MRRRAAVGQDLTVLPVKTVPPPTSKPEQPPPSEASSTDGGSPLKGNLLKLRVLHVVDELLLGPAAAGQTTGKKSSDLSFLCRPVR